MPIGPYAPDRASPLRVRFFSRENTEWLNRQLVTEARTRLNLTISLQQPIHLLPQMRQAMTEYNERQPVHPRDEQEMAVELGRMNRICLMNLLDQLRLTQAQLKTNTMYRELRLRPGYGQQLIPRGDYKDNNPEIMTLQTGLPLFRRR